MEYIIRQTILSLITEAVSAPFRHRSWQRYVVGKIDLDHGRVCFDSRCETRDGGLRPYRGACMPQWPPVPSITPFMPATVTNYGVLYVVLPNSWRQPPVHYHHHHKQCRQTKQDDDEQ
jgi:hypothetical protein